MSIHPCHTLVMNTNFDSGSGDWTATVPTERLIKLNRVERGPRGDDILNELEYRMDSDNLAEVYMLRLANIHVTP
jgi:hypothetical protein